jgi:uncharacterized protein (TIGR02246 family)
MKRSCGCLLVVLFAVGLASAAEPNSHDADRQAIEKSVDSYVAAFNRSDAQGVAAHWSESGEYLTPDGERLQGRQAIAESFQKFFADNQGARIEVASPRVRFVSDDVAIEEGSARLIRPGADAGETTYIAVHVKKNGAWKMDSVRETTVPAPAGGSAYEHLQELEWMIGDWVDQNSASTVETVCQWTKNKSFLTRTFKLSVPGMDDLEGTQVVGWDPLTQSIRGWTFDSDSGYLEGTWTRKGNSWIVKSLGFLASGSRASSVNVYTYIDPDTFTWRSFGREVDGKFLPDIAEVKVVRKQPDAKQQDQSPTAK